MNHSFFKKQEPLLFYGITPPRLNTLPEKRIDIKRKRMDRIQKLPLDGLIIYDVQDESIRNQAERPFPYLPTIDALIYGNEDLKDLTCPKIIYKPVSGLTRAEFENWLQSEGLSKNLYVFVGAQSGNQSLNLRLEDAYRVLSEVKPDILFGGVSIPERHASKGNEHERVFKKSKSGCEFFISQCVYHTELAKNYLSDYYYFCQTKGLEMKRQIFTLTPCGNLNTLNFMKWLGIHIPKWLENDLTHAKDILELSILECVHIAEELTVFCKTKQIPFGFNIESVSNKKEEIEASVSLVFQIRKLLDTVESTR